MGRTPCCNADGLKKGAWTAEEDQKLVAYIQEHGEGGWRTLPHKAGLQRCGKSCRLRWANYLRPDIKRGEFSTEEEERIVELHVKLGNRWSAIARHLPRRTDNEIKNHWNTHLKKRLAEKAIDPTTHKPPAAGPATTTTNTAPLDGEHEEEEPVAPGRDHHRRPSSSSSAKLLNKVASRLAHPLHCLNTLKSILGDGHIERCASTSSVSESTANDVVPAHQTASSEHDDLSFLDSLDPDVLNDWQPYDDTVLMADKEREEEEEEDRRRAYHYGEEDAFFPSSQYGVDGLALYGSYFDEDHGGTAFRGTEQFMDFNGTAAAAATSGSGSNSGQVDDRPYGYGGFDGDQTAAVAAEGTDDVYGHSKFEYQHGAGGLLDGDDEHGRTFFDNNGGGDFSVDAPDFF